MSYREKLFTLQKKEYIKYKNLTFEELKEKYNTTYYEFYYDILNPKILHEFGNNESQTIRKNNFFKKIKQDDYDTTFLIVTKKSLLVIIKKITQDIKDWNKKLFELSLKLDNNDTLLDSWMKEYDIFNLLFIYKTTDWDNEILCLYGA